MLPLNITKQTVKQIAAMASDQESCLLFCCYGNNNAVYGQLTLLRMSVEILTV